MYRLRVVPIALAVLSVGLLAGCSPTGHISRHNPTPANSTPSPSSSPTPTASPTRALGICSAAQLQPWAGLNGAGAGSELSEFAFINIGSQTCALYGYPTVQMLGANGSPISTLDQPAQPGVDSVSPGLVVLSPGGRAYFGLFYPNSTGYSGAPSCPTSAELQFTPPGLASSLKLSGAGAQITPYGGDVENLQCGEIQVTPVTAAKLLPASDGS